MAYRGAHGQGVDGEHGVEWGGREEEQCEWILFLKFVYQQS